MKYEIVHGLTADKLQNEVNQWIVKGYEPVGGVAINGGVFYQAMVVCKIYYETQESVV